MEGLGSLGIKTTTFAVLLPMGKYIRIKSTKKRREADRLPALFIIQLFFQFPDIPVSQKRKAG